MGSYNNGFRIHLGPLMGIDNDFNQAVRKINPQAPRWQQQVGIYDAAALDMSNSTLSYSSFYDPKRLHKVMGQVVNNMDSTFAPGLMDQIFPKQLFKPSVNSSFDFLSIPMDNFYKIANDPDFGKNIQVPLNLEANPNTGVVVPVPPPVGAEALQFAAIGNLSPFYAAANPFQPFSGIFYGNGRQTIARFPLNPGLPNQAGQIITQPFKRMIRERNRPLGIGVYPVKPLLFPPPPLPRF